MKALVQDLRFAIRMFTKSPGFTAAAVVTLTLGIGLNTTIFSIVNAMMFRPVGLPEPDRLVMIYEANRKQGGRRDPTGALYEDWRRHSRLFEDIARGGFFGDPGTLSGIGQAERIRITYATPNFFSMLSQKLVRGRGFLPEDAPSGQGVTAVISHEAWRRLFGSDPGVIGQTVGIDGEKRTIVGVLPDGFSALPWRGGADAWLAYNPVLNPRGRWLQVIGRLKRGATVEQARAELNAIARQSQQSPGEAGSGWSIEVQTLNEATVGSGRENGLYLLMASVGFVLLIACANVANLLLARGAARRKEIAIRAALGAGRWRLVRQLLTESVVLAMLGGAGGLLISTWGADMVVAMAEFESLRSLAADIDNNVLLFTLGISVLTGILFGLAPAIQASRLGLNETLKEAGSRSGGGIRQRGRGALVATEVALAMVLLVGAGLMISSFLRLRRVELGFNAENVLTADIFLNGPKYWVQVPGDKKRVTPQGVLFYRQLLERLQGMPGVVSAAVTHLAPPGDVQVRSFKIIGGPAQPSGRPAVAHYSEVSSGFFRTLEIPLLKGRYLTERDVEGAPWVVVINETMARQAFPNEEPLGKYIQLTVLGGSSEINVEEDRPRQIVGVVGDVRHFGFGDRMRPVMYGSYLQHVSDYPGGYYIGHLWKDVMIRTSSDPMKMAGALQKAAAELDKDQAVFDIQTIERSLATSLSPHRFLLRLFGIFGGLALVLAAVGVYGVMSYSVNQRTHEIGIRIANGAESSDILRLVVGQGLKLTLIGVAAGLAGSMALTFLMSGMLFGIRPADPLTYVVVAFALTAVALTACAIPARRAAKVDPMRALRYE